MEMINKIVAKVKSDRKVQIGVAVVAAIIIYNLVNYKTTSWALTQLLKSQA